MGIFTKAFLPMQFALSSRGKPDFFRSLKPELLENFGKDFQKTLPYPLCVYKKLGSFGLSLFSLMLSSVFYKLKMNAKLKEGSLSNHVETV